MATLLFWAVLLPFPYIRRKDLSSLVPSCQRALNVSHMPNLVKKQNKTKQAAFLQCSSLFSFVCVCTLDFIQQSTVPLCQKHGSLFRSYQTIRKETKGVDVVVFFSGAAETGNVTGGEPEARADRKMLEVK